MNSRNISFGMFGFYKKASSDEKGVQLVEFAFILPFLLVFVVGIVDFGGAYRIYQNVTNASREGARLSALPFYNQPTVPPNNLRNRITAYLASLNLNTSYYSGAATLVSGTTWRYGSATGPNLLIDQSAPFPKLDVAGNPTGIVYDGSRVQLTYPYTYMFFGRVIRLLIPSANYTNPILITNYTLIQNE